MLHTIVISIHAAAGLLGFGVGAALAARPELAVRRRWALIGYLAFLIVLVIGLVVAVVIDWPTLVLGQRFAFGALAALGGYTLYRGIRAVRVSRQQASGWQLAFIGHIGFTLISLFDGFVIVSAIDLGAPGWAVALVAVAGIALGVAGVRALERRAARAAESRPSAPIPSGR